MLRSCESPGRGYNEAKTQIPKIDVAAFDTCEGTLIYIMQAGFLFNGMIMRVVVI